MQVRSFLLTLGLGMAAGGTVALMLPRQSGVRREAQKAADAAAAEHAANEASCQLVAGENVRARDEGEKERRAGNGKEGL